MNPDPNRNRCDLPEEVGLRQYCSWQMRTLLTVQHASQVPCHGLPSNSGPRARGTQHGSKNASSVQQYSCVAAADTRCEPQQQQQ